jgi:hypothetical protein
MQKDFSYKEMQVTGALWKALEARSKSTTIQELLNQGADPYALSENGHSLLTYEISKITIETMPDMPGSDFFYGDCTGYCDTSRLISLLAKTPINFKDRRGKTALHAAIEKGCKQLVNIVLEYGADLCIVDNTGKKPADYTTNLTLKLYLNLFSDQLDFCIKKFKVPGYWPPATTLLCFIYNSFNPKKKFDTLYDNCVSNNKLEELCELFNDAQRPSGEKLLFKIKDRAQEFNLPITPEECKSYVAYDNQENKK